jgi:RNA polymerase sigma factor (TIGR02999 family)
MAHQQRRFRRADRTLNTTALVHEAYLKLVKHPDPSWENRGHFFRVAAKAMRQILVDYAKQKQTAKRGGGVARISLDQPDTVPWEERIQLSDERAEEMLAVNEALERLASFDERLSQIVELRYFAGFTIPETADALDLSPTTVKREWITARAWLSRELKE